MKGFPSEACSDYEIESDSFIVVAAGSDLGCSAGHKFQQQYFSDGQRVLFGQPVWIEFRIANRHEFRFANRHEFRIANRHDFYITNYITKHRH